MDRDGADFKNALKSLKSRLGVECLPLQYPIIKNEVTVGYVDLLALDVHVWLQSGGATQAENQQHQSAEVVVTKFDDYEDEEVKIKALEARSKLFDQLSDYDDEFCEEMLELMESSEEGSGSPSLKNIIAAVKRVCNLTYPSNGGSSSGGENMESSKPRVIPCLMGASLRGIGVEALLDASVALLPNPTERSPPFVSSADKKKQLSVKPQDPLCGLAFKVSNDPHRGALVYLRVYSGTLKKGQVLQCGGVSGQSASDVEEESTTTVTATATTNSTKGFKERMTHLLKPFGDELIPIGEEGAGPGETVVAVGLKKTVTGDTIVGFKGPLHGWTLPRIPIPHPVSSPI
jgi:elongation factor G